jgi:hypothetical protein
MRSVRRTEPRDGKTVSGMPERVSTNGFPIYSLRGRKDGRITQPCGLWLGFDVSWSHTQQKKQTSKTHEAVSMEFLGQDYKGPIIYRSMTCIYVFILIDAEENFFLHYHQVQKPIHLFYYHWKQETIKQNQYICVQGTNEVKDLQNRGTQKKEGQ